jgi:Rieske Fe-S protein
LYDASGQVLDGPPPHPLRTIDARVDGTDETVLVRV